MKYLLFTFVFPSSRNLVNGRLNRQMKLNSGVEILDINLVDIIYYDTFHYDSIILKPIDKSYVLLVDNDNIQKNAKT